MPEPANGNLDDELMNAIDSQIGDLGEETAAVHLTELDDVTVVTMGDSGMPRQAGRQDLDLVAVVDGELTAFEVKTRYRSKDAGRLTRAGNLRRPRLQRPKNSTTYQQGGQRYVGQRLKDIIDTGDGYEGINVRVVAAVDLKAMLAQQFYVNNDGRSMTPIGKPTDCRSAAEQAFGIIVAHRGHL